MKLGGNLILWKCAFQNIVSHSSTESELMSLDVGATVGQYISWLCEAMAVKLEYPIHIYVDNKSTIDIASNPIQPGRNLHIHARYFYVRDLVNDKLFIISKIHTDDQPSDILCTFKSKHTFIRLRTLVMNCAFVELLEDKITWNVTYI